MLRSPIMRIYLLVFIALAVAFAFAYYAYAAFVSPTTITIDGTFSDWGTTGSPATGVAVIQDASNSGNDDGSGFNNTVKDLNYFWAAAQTQNGGTANVSGSNLLQYIYYRMDSFETSATLTQAFNIQLNLGTAPAGKADHLLQLYANADGDSTEVTIVMYQYNRRTLQSGHLHPVP